MPPALFALLLITDSVMGLPWGAAHTACHTVLCCAQEHIVRGRTRAELALPEAIRALAPELGPERVEELILLGAVYCGEDILKARAVL